MSNTGGDVAEGGEVNRGRWVGDMENSAYPVRILALKWRMEIVIRVFGVKSTGGWTRRLLQFYSYESYPLHLVSIGVGIVWRHFVIIKAKAVTQGG